LAKDTASAACLLFADFAHYFTMRKQRERRCLLFADEFSAVAGASDVAMKVEQARSFNTGLVLIPQTPSGVGPRTQRDRILGSVETLIVHAVNEPEEIAALAGTTRAVELTHRYEEGVREREGFARGEERPKVHPDRVRELPTGTAWVIRRGRATKVAVERAPSAERAALPEAQPLDPLREPVEVAAPKEIACLDEED
jgi:type IV secretory pathway TraG/TraD family ATPase VirD4